MTVVSSNCLKNKNMDIISCKHKTIILILLKYNPNFYSCLSNFHMYLLFMLTLKCNSDSIQGFVKVYLMLTVNSVIPLERLEGIVTINYNYILMHCFSTFIINSLFTLQSKLPSLLFSHSPYPPNLPSTPQRG